MSRKADKIALKRHLAKALYAVYMNDSFAVRIFYESVQLFGIDLKAVLVVYCHARYKYSILCDIIRNILLEIINSVLRRQTDYFKAQLFKIIHRSCYGRMLHSGSHYFISSAFISVCDSSYRKIVAFSRT